MYEGLLGGVRTTMREEVSYVGSLALNAVTDVVVMIRDGWILVHIENEHYGIESVEYLPGPRDDAESFIYSFPPSIAAA